MRRKSFAYVLALGAAAWMAGAGAQSWQGNLKGGGTVEVDPHTHKPTVHYRGAATPLWNGVHRLDDGSVIIVRDGVVVPDESMLRTWRGEPTKQATKADAACEELVHATCGLGGECGVEHACAQARQLQHRVQEEARQLHPGQQPASLQECRKGLSDRSKFPVCTKDSVATPCGRLVARVCGAKGECAKAPACDAARQLLDMEREERVKAGRPQAATETGKQCREAMHNAYFTACAGH